MRRHVRTVTGGSDLILVSWSVGGEGDRLLLWWGLFGWLLVGYGEQLRGCLVGMESPRERNGQEGDDWKREEQLWFIYGEGRGDLVRESMMWRLWLGEGKGKGSRG